MEHTAPYLEDGETITAVIATASGPLPPLFPLVPVAGVVAMFTRWYRVFGVVVTNRRFILMRKRKVGGGRLLGRVDIAAPLHQVEVVRWTARPSYGTLTVRVGGRHVRLHVSGTYTIDIPAVLAALPTTP